MQWKVSCNKKKQVQSFIHCILQQDWCLMNYNRCFLVLLLSSYDTLKALSGIFFLKYQNSVNILQYIAVAKNIPTPIFRDTLHHFYINITCSAKNFRSPLNLNFILNGIFLVTIWRDFYTDFTLYNSIHVHGMLITNISTMSWLTRRLHAICSLTSINKTTEASAPSITNWNMIKNTYFNDYNKTYIKSCKSKCMQL